MRMNMLYDTYTYTTMCCASGMEAVKCAKSPASANLRAFEHENMTLLLAIT